MQSEYFIFNGINSEDMGLYIIRMDTGFITNPFIGSKSLNQAVRPGRVKASREGLTREVIEFDLQMVLLDDYGKLKEWTPEERMRIARWLFQDEYAAFQTEDDLGKIYYGMFTNEQNLFTMNNTGYLELHFVTNSHTAWSPVIDHAFDFWNNDAGGRIITIENLSNISKNYEPKIEIEMKHEVGESNLEFKLINLSNDNKEFIFTGLRRDEIISVDNENRIILSSYSAHINPYGSFNKNWLELVYGENQLQIFGKCAINIQCQFPIMR